MRIGNVVQRDGQVIPAVNNAIPEDVSGSSSKRGFVHCTGMESRIASIRRLKQSININIIIAIEQFECGAEIGDDSTVL